MTEPELTTAVFATATGRAYHATDTCAALSSGQFLHEPLAAGVNPGRPMGQACIALFTTPQQATAVGKHPCTTCKPPGVEPPASGETFGHEPWFVCLPDFRKGYGCARCRVRVRVPNISHDDTDRGTHIETHAVPWPCTSARVLGLAFPAASATDGGRR